MIESVKSRRFLCLAICILVLLLPLLPAFAEESDEPAAQNVSLQCKIVSSQAGFQPYALTDQSLQTSYIFAEGATLTYHWKEDVTVAACYIFFADSPDSYLLTQKDAEGAILAEQTFAPARRCEWILLEAGCRELFLQLPQRCKLNAFSVFSGPVPPPEVIVWRQDSYDESIDLMLISTHCDDEILMLGGVLPIYAGEEGRDCTVVYMKGSEAKRRLESILGLWEMGVKREPTFLMHSNASLQNAITNAGAEGLRTDALRDLVRLIRMYRPAVVVTQDENGEYGHEAHILSVELVKMAVSLASDPTKYPSLTEQYGAWQVKKLYLHLYGENKLELDVETPLPRMNGRSALKVAIDAFAYHVSQQKNWSVYKTHALYPIGQYGLFFTAVGADTGRNDMFEHIPRADATSAPKPVMLDR